MTLSLEDVTCSLYISIYTHIQSCTYILFVGLYILSLSFCYYYCITKTIYIYIRIHIQYPFASHSRQISPPGGTQLLLPSFVEAISKDRQKNVFVGQFVVRKLKHPQMGAKWVHQNRAGWWQLKYFLEFSSLFGEDEPILTHIVLGWVGSTTNKLAGLFFPEKNIGAKLRHAKATRASEAQAQNRKKSCCGNGLA